MNFGLSGTPSTFQNAMNKIFRLLLGKRVLVNLDDVIAMVATFEEHLNLLRKVFTRFSNDGLTEKLEKFLRRETKYLGIKMTQHGIKTDSQKTKAITLVLLPKICEQVATFLGMTTWFSKFIFVFPSRVNLSILLRGKE